MRANVVLNNRDVDVGSIVKIVDFYVVRREGRRVLVDLFLSFRN
jgi:hypothetical protein